MKEQFSYYDLLAHVIPGTLFLAVLSLIKNLLGLSIPLRLSLPSELGVSAALVFASGHALQALSSLVEPAYERLWGGKPSIRLLSKQTKHFTTAHREKTVTIFKTRFNIKGDLKDPADFRQLFSCCKALVNKEGFERVKTFNAVYAFHRVLLTTSLLTMLALFFVVVLPAWLKWVKFPTATFHGVIFLLALAVAGTGIGIIRTKQRGDYYAREVIEMALLIVEQANGAKGEAHGTKLPLY